MSGRMRVTAATAGLADLHNDLHLVSFAGEALAVARRQEGLGDGHQRVCPALHKGFTGRRRYRGNVFGLR